MNNQALDISFDLNDYVIPKSCMDCQRWADCMLDQNTDPKVAAFISNPANYGDADMSKCPGYTEV